MSAGNVIDPMLDTAAALDPRLKYDLSGKKPIVLIPQPSDDPNDPLVYIHLSIYKPLHSYGF